MNEQAYSVGPECGRVADVPGNAKAKATLAISGSIRRVEAAMAGQVSRPDDNAGFWSPALIHNGTLDLSATGVAEFTCLGARSIGACWIGAAHTDASQHNNQGGRECPSVVALTSHGTALDLSNHTSLDDVPRGAAVVHYSTGYDYDPLAKARVNAAVLCTGNDR